MQDCRELTFRNAVNKQLVNNFRVEFFLISIVVDLIFRSVLDIGKSVTKGISRISNLNWLIAYCNYSKLKFI